MSEPLAFHEIANAFPLMEGKDFDELVDDIRINGLLMPITILDEKILDGRNRYRACLKARVEPHFTPFLAKMSPIDFVISMNLARRQLTVSQRAAAAAELANMKSGTRTDLPPKGGRSSQVSKKEAAEKLKVSPRIVERATAVKKADPVLFKDVKEGKASVHAAAKAVSRTAAKYVAKQDAKLGPIEAAPKLSAELATTLKGKKASLNIWTRELQGSGIPAVVAALTAAIEVVERHLNP
jgi:ParB-like chromosome segregation protein Spo0J